GRAPHDPERAQGRPQARRGAAYQPALPQPVSPGARCTAAASQARARAPLLRRPPGGFRRHLRVGAPLPGVLRATSSEDGRSLSSARPAPDRSRTRSERVACKAVPLSRISYPSYLTKDVKMISEDTVVSVANGLSVAELDGEAVVLSSHTSTYFGLNEVG